MIILLQHDFEITRSKNDICKRLLLQQKEEEKKKKMLGEMVSR